VRQAVWARDGGRCAFVSTDGRRCADERFLEFHHVVPYARGGPSTADNIELRCRAHNGYEAERHFGRWDSVVREESAAYAPGPSACGVAAVLGDDQATCSGTSSSPLNRLNLDARTCKGPRSEPGDWNGCKNGRCSLGLSSASATHRRSGGAA
jgi:hypothetical protein